MSKNIFNSKSGLFTMGVLFGTAGIKMLKSDKAHKGYVRVLAEVLKGREAVSDGLTILKESADDIYEEARFLNEAEEIEKTMADEEEEIFFDEDGAYVETECDAPGETDEEEL